MSVRPVDLRFGPSAFSRLDCVNCGPNSLHKHNVCIHCGRNHSQPALPTPPWNGYSKAGPKR